MWKFEICPEMHPITKMTNFFTKLTDFWESDEIARLNRHDMLKTKKTPESWRIGQIDKDDFISPNLLTKLCEWVWREHCSILYTSFQHMLCSSICSWLSLPSLVHRYHAFCHLHNASQGWAVFWTEEQTISISHRLHGNFEREHAEAKP